MYKKFLLFFVLLLGMGSSTWAVEYDFESYAKSQLSNSSGGTGVSETSSGTTKVYNGKTCTIYSDITAGDGFEMSRFALETNGIFIRKSTGTDPTYGLHNTGNEQLFVVRNLFIGQKVKINFYNWNDSNPITYTTYGDGLLNELSANDALTPNNNYTVTSSGDLVLSLKANTWIYSITIEDGTVFDFMLSTPNYRSDGQSGSVNSATKDGITLTFKSGASSGKVTTENKESGTTNIHALKFQPTTSFTLKAANNMLIKKVMILCRENNREWSLTGDGSISRDEYVTTWTGATNGELIFTNNNTSNLNISSIYVEYETITGEIATYQLSDNSLTFTGAGRLYTKKFDMLGYAIELGNVDSDEQGTPYVIELNSGHGVHLIDKNGYDFGNPYDGTGWGTYYTIKTKSDGHLFVYAQGLIDTKTNQPATYGTPLYLKIEDGNHTIRKQIPFGQFDDGVTTIDLGYIYKDKTYTLYCGWPSVLSVQKFEYYPVNGQLLEYEDYDEYSSSNQDPIYVWTSNNGKSWRASVHSDEDTHGQYAQMSLPANEMDKSYIYEFKGLDLQNTYTVSFEAAISSTQTYDHTSQIALYTTKPNQDSFASDYLFAVTIDHNNNYSVFVNGNKIEDIGTRNISAGDWLYYEVKIIDGNKLRYKITNSTTGYTVSNTYQNEDISLTGSYKALGISFFDARYETVGKFDNILVTSSQLPMGDVTAPTIEVSQILGQRRQVTVSPGVSEYGRTVTTYFEYTTLTTSNVDGNIPLIDESGHIVLDENGDIVYVSGKLPYDWNFILDQGTWTSWNQLTNDNKTFTLEPAVNNEITIYYVRAISTITDYTTVQSDTAYLRVVTGEDWKLTGGFAVQEMNKVVINNDTQETEKYYTPTVRAYVDTRLLSTNDIANLRMYIEYQPIDYAYVDGNDSKPDFVYELGSVENNIIQSVPLTDSRIKHDDGYYYEFTVPRSAEYILHISGGNDFTPATYNHIYYKNKYKVTYQTPNFGATTNPISEFMDVNDQYTDGTNYKSGIYGYTPWRDWTGATLPYQLKDWNNEGAHDFYWNSSTKGITATLNSISPAKSGGSTQTYNIRTTQYDVSNPIFLRRGWGIVKDSDTPWSYSCALAHIGMGNEIPEFTIDDGMGRNHHQYKVYPTPFITGSNTPECTVSVPSRAALVQYKVYTPVETKKVDASTGLASFSSYYSLYHVSDYFMDNDELVGTFFAPGHYRFGSNYYISQCWYLKERQGYLLAANIYTNTDIWDGYAKFVSTDKDVNPNPWSELKYAGGTSQVHADGDDVVQDGTIDVEIRIIDATPSYGWSNTRTNEIKPVLMDDDREAHSGEYETIYASSIVNDEVANPNGFANMVLLPGKRDNKDCYNFFCLPKISSKARLGNKTAYIQRTDTYQDYLNRQPSVKEEGERIIFGLGDFDEAVGIDMVENNANATARGNDIFYNIAGQKVSSPTKGIYIYNGKKVLVK